MIVNIKTKQKFWSELRKIGFAKSGVESVFWSKHVSCYTKNYGNTRVMVGLAKTHVSDKAILCVFNKETEKLNQHIFVEWEEILA